MKQGRLFISAKPGDVIKVGKHRIVILKIAGRVRMQVEADKQTAIQHEASSGDTNTKT